MRSMRAILAEFEERGARNNSVIEATSDDKIGHNGRTRRPIVGRVGNTATGS